jgi:uncharacterized membrane protein YhfC
MVLLSISIVFALIVTIGLPIMGAVWLNKRLNTTWQTVALGALGYFIVQSLFTLLYSGIGFLSKGEFAANFFDSNSLAQIAINITLAAVLGVALRWAGLKYIKMPLINLQAAYGIGLGYGGVESITRFGLPLLMTFYTMLRNTNLQTSTLDPEIINQLETLWRTSPWIPLAGSVERITAMVIHITVTILVLQYFTRNKMVWLVAAAGLETVINLIIFGLMVFGSPPVWVFLIGILAIAGCFYLLYRLNAFYIGKTTSQNDTI